MKIWSIKNYKKTLLKKKLKVALYKCIFIIIIINVKKNKNKNEDT